MSKENGCGVDTCYNRKCNHPFKPLTWREFARQMGYDNADIPTIS